MIIVPGASRIQLLLHYTPFGNVPAWLAVGKHTTIRNLISRIEDHKGFRFPTNQICVCSHMTASISNMSIKSTVASISYISRLRLHSSVHPTTAWTPPPKPSTGGSQDTLWVSPDLMSYDLALPDKAFFTDL